MAGFCCKTSQASVGFCTGLDCYGGLCLYVLQLVLAALKKIRTSELNFITEAFSSFKFCHKSVFSL